MTARILIAEGIATNRIRLKVRLAAACYDVQTAKSWDQLQDRLRQMQPDIVILGAGFAGVTPVQMCRALRADSQAARLPVLMLASGREALEAMRAGATATLAPDCDEVMLLARLRGLMRDAENAPDQQMAEAPASFQRRHARIALIADTPARALCWKHLLASRLPHEFLISDADSALADAAAGRACDLYIIATRIARPGDGLRLLSELRARPASRDAGFIAASAAQGVNEAAVALDLGAGDLMPLVLAGQSGGDAAALSITEQLARKWQRDHRREAEQRTALWAMTDPLTGLHNRRYALPKLAQMLGGAAKARAPLAVLALDLDRFKSVNDRFGHAAGDAVLVEIAARITRVAGDTALTARLGGEEFLVALPDTGLSAATVHAEALRQVIMHSPIRLPNGTALAVTLSIGLAVAHPEPTAQGGSEDQAQALLARADHALMAAKAGGRNRVILAQTDHAA